MATSRPILFRNLKQSATVFAGLNTRRVAPEDAYSFTPKRSVGPDMRTRRIGGEETLGAQAFCPMAIHTSCGDWVVAGGGYALYTIPVEAFPDLTNNQVVIVTEAPSLPPTEVEQLVTYPIERAMLGLPKKEEVRSLSKLGLSMVTVVFDDSVPMYFARQLVSERLQQISSLLPAGIQPSLGLPATAFGELYQYTLSGPMSAMDLKVLHEWVVKG